jgi:hypothetical protein
MKNLNEIIKANGFSLQEIISAAVIAAKENGQENIFSHYKFREIALAELLGHKAHDKVSNGDGRGSDAISPEGVFCEYKSVKDNHQIYDLYKGKIKNKRKKQLKISMVYNGAYSLEKIEAYKKVDHYAGLFNELEEPVLVLKVKTSHVIETLTKNLEKMKGGKTTNFNSIHIDLFSEADKEFYEVVYDREK